MRTKNCYLLVVFFSIIIMSCGANIKSKKKNVFAKDNLCAWCLVPYDSLNRNPEQRAQMMKDLGITRFAYDWRTCHLPYFAEEIQALRKYGIQLSAVWFWTDGSGPTLLNEDNEKIIKTLKEENLKTNLWVAFPEQFFMNMSDDERLKKAVNAITEIHQRAEEIGCKISLYNHGGWYGDPENMIKIIKTSGFNDIGIVYNFLRGTHDKNKFKILLNEMMPYLTMINLDGLKGNGPESWTDVEVVGPPYILNIDDGDREQDMIKIIYESDYQGQIGLIGHTLHEDVKVVMQRNLNGLYRVLDSLKINNQ